MEQHLRSAMIPTHAPPVHDVELGSLAGASAPSPGATRCTGVDSPPASPGTPILAAAGGVIRGAGYHQVRQHDRD